MNVIKRKVLEAFWQGRGGPRTKKPLLDWFKICRKAKWKSLAETRMTFRHADLVKVKSGRTATVFNVGGWKIRVITLIDYTRQTMLVTHVLTHKEYDQSLWKEQI